MILKIEIFFFTKTPETLPYDFSLAILLNFEHWNFFKFPSPKFHLNFKVQ